MSNTLKEQSKQLLDTLVAQINSLLEHNHKAPQIEIDIAKDNMRKLYELIDALSGKNIAPIVSQQKVEDIDKEINDLLAFAESQFSSDNEEIEEQIKEQEIVLEEQNEEDKIEPEIPNEEEVIKVHEEIASTLEETEPAVAEVTVEDLSFAEALDEDSSFAEVTDENPTFAEAPDENENPTFAEVTDENPTFAEATEDNKELPIIEDTADSGSTDFTTKTVHVLDVMPDEEDNEEDLNILLPSKVKLKPIKSLKSGIGINDKFMIINDLFEGRAKDFNASIKKLDSLENVEKALFLLGDMKDENLWEVNDKVFLTFKMYVERRYSKN